MKICVYGAASSLIDKSFIDAGEELGRKMAKRGIGLVFGGGRNGMMGAVARGELEENGEIIGIAPAFFEDANAEVSFKECTEFIHTETMRERKGIMEDKADAFIVMPGGIGTFEELYEIVTLKQLQRHEKPIIIYNYKNFYNKTIEILTDAVNENFISKDVFKLFSIATSEDEIFEQLENYVPCLYEKFTH